MDIRQQSAYNRIRDELIYLRNHAQYEDEYWHYDGLLDELEHLAHEVDITTMKTAVLEARGAIAWWDDMGLPPDELYDSDDESDYDND